MSSSSTKTSLYLCTAQLFSPRLRGSSDFKRILVIFFCAFLFSASPAFAYSDDTTHRGLTRDAVRLYRSSYSDAALSTSDEEALVKGAFEEDFDYRFMRHFYDPIHNSGLTYLSELNFGRPWSSSKEWAIGGDPENIDHTWPEAVRLYKSGEREKAMEVLGHILHLIEDATVPDHTRGDPHPPLLEFGSPFERFAKSFGPSEIGVGKQLGEKGVVPLVFSSIEEGFDSTASFSNRHFFSKDTIEDPAFTSPVIEYFSAKRTASGDEALFAMRSIPEYGASAVARVGRQYQFESGKLVRKYFLTVDDNSLMEQYWQVLSEYAVRSSAGVVRLFFEEVGEAPQRLVETQDERTILAEIQPFSVADTFPLVVKEEKVVLGEMSESFAARVRPLPGAPSIHLYDTETGDPLRQVFDLARESGVASMALSEGTPSSPLDESSGEEEVDMSTSTEASPARGPDDEASSDGPNEITFFAEGTTTVLSRAHSPYIVRAYLLVPSNAKVVLGAGTVLKFAPDAGLRVAGTLVASGTPSFPVVFSSIFDDTYGGDSNGDGVCGRDLEATCPTRGSWRHLYFEPGSTNSSLESSLIRFGGQFSPLGISYLASGIFVEGSSIRVQSCTLEGNGMYGLYLQGGSSEIRDTHIVSAAPPGDVTMAGIYAESDTSRVERVTVEGYQTGISTVFSHGIFSHNMVRGGVAAYISADGVGAIFEGNNATGTEANGIAIVGTALRAGEQGVLKRNEVPYATFRSAAIFETDSHLLIEPGVVWKIDGSRLILDGSLSVRGIEEAPVRISAISDDSDGNDFFGDGQKFPENLVGAQGLLLRTAAHTDISHARLSNFDPAIRYHGSPVDLDSVLFIHNGVAIAGEADGILRATNLTFVDNITDSVIDLSH
ncbi:MAG: right-handed parallel beta-helix repeat-containing protein [Patescibacteria group bacterium]